MRKCKHHGWKKELLGWDDGDVYVFHKERGNFSVKRHPELQRKLVDMAIQYFEEHKAKSEDEIMSEGGVKYYCSKCGGLTLFKPEDVDAGRAKCKHCGSKLLKPCKTLLRKHRRNR